MRLRAQSRFSEAMLRFYFEDAFSFARLPSERDQKDTLFNKFLALRKI